ncbi:hypothetical protein TNCV_908101 [Trichonephila clavipes]|nr:hypothetical protein TNCV_908101 [Trichonephila clavipes]
MLRSRQQGTFAMEAYFSNNWSVVAVQRAFRRYIDISPQSRVPPDRKCVLMGMDAFQATRNVSKGPQKTVRTPENVERVRVSIQCDIDPTVLNRSPKKGSQ